LFQNGAKAIYFADVENIWEVTELDFVHLSHATSRGLIYTSNHSGTLFNSGYHYACFKESISDAASASAISLYYLCQRDTAVYVPAIIDHRYSSDAGVTCNKMAPDVTMGAGVYTDISVVGAYFLEPGFWTFHAFAENNFNVVWSYMTQWLLWHTGKRFTTYWSGIRHLHYRTDVNTYQIISMLDNLECSDDFVSCTYFIAERIIDAQLVSKDFLPAVRQWFAVLLESGYSFPHLFVSSKSNTCMTDLDEVKYQPLDVSESSMPNQQHNIPIANLIHSVDLYEKTCFGQIVTADVTVDLSKPWKQFNHIMLVITFNEPHYEVIPYLEILYRSVFPHIIYCGPHIDFSHHTVLKDYKITFITYKTSSAGNVSGALSYECAIKIAHLNYHAKGYLFASDDLLLFPAMLAKLNEDSVWFIPQSEIRIGDLKTMRECHLGMCDFFTHWTWWEEYRNATVDALNVMSSYCSISSLFCNCLSELKRLNGEHLRVNGGYSDVFYLPHELMRDFSTLADVFLKSGVFLEIAVPTTLRCLQLPEDVQSVPGKQVSLHLESLSKVKMLTDIV
jgi:hypothetical protein